MEFLIMRELQDWHLFQWGTQKYQNYLRKWIPASILIGFSAGILMAGFIFFIQTIGIIVSNNLGILGIPIAIIGAGLLTAILAKRYREV